jgi:ribonuclease P/MRP protein subunit RPP40
VERLHQEIEKGRPTAAVFFDVTKEFDVVDHNFMETKLYSIGLRGKILKWLISFLSNRQLTVKINNKTSKVFETNIGVAQGSVLDPLIFLIFINELPLYIKNGLVTIFADDTSVVVSAPNKNDLDTLI